MNKGFNHNIEENNNISILGLPSIPVVKIDSMKKYKYLLEDNRVEDNIKDNQAKRVQVMKKIRDGISQDQFLPKIVKDFLSKLEEELGITIDYQNQDLSSYGRLKCEDKESFDKKYENIAEKVKNDALSLLKYPTTTLKRQVIEEFIEAFDISFTDEEQKKDYIERQAKSPNAILRKLLGLNVLIRPFENACYKRPILSQNLDVFTPKVENLFVKQKSGIVKKIDYAKIDTMLQEVIVEARKKDRKTIYIASKNTISKFDAQFVDYCTEFLTKHGFDVKDPLFDSFYPTLIADGYENEVVICPPDQAKMLKFLEDVDQTQVPEVIGNNTIKDVKVFRIATGSGYGEKFHKYRKSFKETYSLNEKDVEVSAKHALAEAKKQGKKVILVLADNENNIVDKELIRLVKKSIGLEDFKKYVETKNISDVVASKIKHPINDETVFLAANNTGDYLTDFFPQFFYGKLGAAALGAGYEIALGEDDKGNTIVKQFAPSTGTAPDIKNINDLNPAGMLSAVIELLLYSNITKDVKEKLLNVKKEISNVLLQLNEKENETGKYEGFVQKVMDRVISTLSNPLNTAV